MIHDRDPIPEGVEEIRGLLAVVLIGVLVLASAIASVLLWVTVMLFAQG